MSKIKASRNGETREFELEFWKNLPEDKYGWKPAAETPEEVKGLQESINGQAGEGVQLGGGLPPVVKEPAAETPEEVKEEVKEEVVKPATEKKNAEAKK